MGIKRGAMVRAASTLAPRGRLGGPPPTCPPRCMDRMSMERVALALCGKCRARPANAVLADAAVGVHALR